MMKLILWKDGNYFIALSRAFLVCLTTTFWLRELKNLLKTFLRKLWKWKIILFEISDLLMNEDDFCQHCWDWNSSSVCVWVTDFSLEWFWQLENRREIVFRAIKLRSGIGGDYFIHKKLLFGVCRHIWLLRWKKTLNVIHHINGFGIVIFTF